MFSKQPIKSWQRSWYEGEECKFVLRVKQHSLFRCQYLAEQRLKDGVNFSILCQTSIRWRQVGCDVDLGLHATETRDRKSVV